MQSSLYIFKNPTWIIIFGNPVLSLFVFGLVLWHINYCWIFNAKFTLYILNMVWFYGIPNDEYENFVNAHLEAAAKYIPTKIKTKYRVPWETLAVREKRALVKTASKNYRKKPTNTNILKLKTAQYKLAGIYIKEHTE